MAEDFDVEAMLEAPYKKEEDNEKHNGENSADKENRRSSSTKKKKKSRSRSKTRDGKRSRSRSRDKKRSRSRDRKRGRSRDKKRSRSRDKKRSHSRDKKRSRSKERKSGGRSHDKKRSRSREKKRSRSRDKKRSRSRDKKRSRSRDKKRSRSREKKRSVSKDKKRSRSRERKRSLSKDKKRSRSKEKKRSRSRDKTSPSKDKKRSRSRDRKRSSKDRKERRRTRSRSKDKKTRDKKSKSKSPRRERRRRSRSPRKRSPRRSPLGSGTQFFDSLKNSLPGDDPNPDDRDLRTLFCMHLNQKLRARDLEEFFSSVGAVRDVKIIMDNKTRRSKGIAYVEFAKTDSIPLALGLNGTELMGYRIVVALSQAEKNRVAAPTTNLLKAAPGPMRLYVGSLHFNITEEMLKGIFEPFGKIEKIELIKDTETGRSKGYGFISFFDSEDAKKALEQLNGFELAGRPMKVGHVTERNDLMQGPSFLDSDELDRTGIDLGATGRLQLMAKLAEGTDLNIPAAAVSALQMSQGLVAPQQPTIAPPIATQCFLLSNMFDPATVFNDRESNPSWDEEIRNDVIEECKKHGGAMHVFVDKMSPQGNVYVKCPTIAAAVASVTALHGRWFAGRIITAAYVPVVNYHSLFPDSVVAPILT